MNKILDRYLKEKRSLIFFLVSFLILLTLSLLLLKIPMVLVIYLDVIYLFLITIYFLIDFYKEKKILNRIKLIENLEFKEIKQHLELLELNSIEAIELKKLIFQYNEAIENTLNIANSNLEKTNEYISTWIHQIKLPITSMYLILNEEDSELSRELKEDLLRIELYIDMILTYFRLESPSTDYVFKKIDLFNLIKKEIKKFRNEFIRRGLGISLIPFNVSIISDEKWLSFILDQIISNALKYTSEGKITIYFKDNSLFIQDTGIGITQSNLPRIFERGFTGYNGRINTKASGLGLYLVKRICNALEIPIFINSIEKKGTTVQLVLKANNNSKTKNLQNCKIITENER